MQAKGYKMIPNPTYDVEHTLIELLDGDGRGARGRGLWGSVGRGTTSLGHPQRV